MYKNNLLEKTYYKSLARFAIEGDRKASIELIKDKVNKDNIKLVLNEINEFAKQNKITNTLENNEVYDEIMRYLREIQSDLLISRFVSKEPYMKKITNDNIINITGESGSGKSYYSQKYMNNDNYIIVDTDLIFSNNSCNNIYINELRELFKDNDKSILMENFDNCYEKIINCLKKYNKIIVIDSAQFRNIKDIKKLKGKLIVIRTSIETCYTRAIERFKNNTDKTEETVEHYAKRKIKMFNWYHSLNKFLEKIDKI